MRDLWIDISRIYNKYKLVIWFFIAIVVLFLLVMRAYDKMLNEKGDSSSSNATTISVNVNKESVLDTVNKVSTSYTVDNEKTKSLDEIYKSMKSKTDVITAFVALCNNKQPDLAYELISDECKQELYKTEDEFKSKYYGVIFKTYKKSDIVGFKNNTYKVSLMEQSIATGSTERIKIEDYITIVEDGEKYKLNINKYISNSNVDISSQSHYFDATIKNKTVYKDCEIYTLNIKNNTKADIYINQSSDSKLFIVNDENERFDIVSEDYNDTDYLVPAESERSIKVKFNKDYIKNSTIKEMVFSNIRIVNKEYYDSSTLTVDDNGQVHYQMKKTMYPVKTIFSINLEQK